MTNHEKKLTQPAGHPILWLDYVDYAADLLAAGAPPWLHVADCIAWLRKAQGLLHSDVVTLPVNELTRAWISAHANLRQSMAARRKVGYPLKALLGDAALREYLIELLSGLRASFGGTILALTCPVPEAWIAEAYEDAFGDGASTEIDDDAVDAAAVHIADFLRIFGQSGLDVLLLTGMTGAVTRIESRLELYQPIFNVCGHYRWDAGLIAADGTGDAMPPDMTFAVTRASTPGGRGLVLVPESFWTEGSVQKNALGERLYARIPAHGTPETVLQRLSSLRQ